MSTRFPVLPLAALLAPLALIACSDSDDDDGPSGGGTPGTATTAVQFVLGQVPPDGLLVFETNLAGLRLRRPDGTLTEDLLGPTQSVELVGLDDARRLLRVAEVPEGTYDAVRVAFAPGGVTAKSSQGLVVAVTGDTASWTAPFAGPVQLGGPATRTVALELDLADAVSGDPTFGVVEFDPTGGASLPTTSTPIDEVRGTLVAIDPVAQSFTLEAFADDAATLPIGVVTVSLAPAALLLLPDDVPAPDPFAFAQALVPGQSWLEVHGLLQPDSTIVAHLVELEDGPPFGSGGDALVRLRGRVMSVGAGEFELAVQSIQDGASVAGPVLAGLGDPPTITCAWGAGTQFELDAAPFVAGPGFLAPGADVKVRFEFFNFEPFPATEVEFEALGPEHEGRITDVSELPDRFTMRLFPSEAAVLAGAVASATTDVVVELGGSADPYLHLSGSPVIAKADLLADLRVRVRGFLSGDPSSPTIAAKDVRVRPGHVDDAHITASDPGGLSFFTTGGDFEEAFGSTIGPGPLTVRVEPTAETPGHDDVADFFADLDSAEEVEIKGIGTGVPGEVRAFWVRADD